MKLSIGEKAPDFNCNDQNGNKITLSSFRGKKIVLYFYPKDMTPGCTAESCNLRDNYKALQKNGYVVFGISTDNEKSHQKFIAKERLPFSLLADTDKKVHQAYGTWVEKSMYGRKYMGTARVTFIINEAGIIEEIINQVDTKNHASQILKTASKPDKPENKKTLPTSRKKAVKGAKAKPVKKKAKKSVKGTKSKTK